MRNALIAVAVVLLIPALVRAQTPACDKLAKEHKALATKILQSEHPYDCCDDTIAACLKKKPVCSLAYRLAENICDRVAKGQDEAKIRRALSRRALSMISMGKKAQIDLKDAPVAGKPDAPVVLVEYACARCPYCAKITPKVYEAVTKGPLAGKVRLYFKAFPIRNHEYSKETGLGFMAAHRLGRFWEFLNITYERFDAFCIKKQPEWAKDAGMDPARFSELVADPNLRKQLVESKKEGIVNGVEATPTFFIGGRKYSGELSIEELVDVLEEEYDRVTGATHRR